MDTTKRNSLLIIEVPEGEEEKKGSECLFKDIMVENFPNMGRELNIQIHEAN